MSFYQNVKRTVAKSIIFRVLVMLADVFIIYAITKKIFVAMGIIFFSNISSTIIYYLHERVWLKVEWGKKK